MRTYITTLMLVVTLGLVSCGGGNDVASSGATAVSAAAPTPASTTTATASAPSTTTAATTTTEPKVNGQIDERTGVAPVVAQATIWTPYSNGGCINSSSWNAGGTGPAITQAQQNACIVAINNTTTYGQCIALGNIASNCWSGAQNSCIGAC